MRCFGCQNLIRNPVLWYTYLHSPSSLLYFLLYTGSWPSRIWISDGSSIFWTYLYLSVLCIFCWSVLFLLLIINFRPVSGPNYRIPPQFVHVHSLKYKHVCYKTNAVNTQKDKESDVDKQVLSDQTVTVLHGIYSMHIICLIWNASY